MGKLPRSVSAEHADVLRAYQLDQERRGLLPSSIEHSARTSRYNCKSKLPPSSSAP